MIFTGAENVFVINDIALQIPPTNIQVRRESLTYQWRTLRTSVATKIASGHGNCVISVRIPWLDSQILTIHRLIVEIKNNPYCFVDNQFLRDSLVPHWGTGQNMAFTVMGMSLTRMPETSNAWVMELDLQWFNYAPFTPNFLYREDWVTVPIDTKGPERLDGHGGVKVFEAGLAGTGSAPQSSQYSIGWKFNPVTNSRIPHSCLVSDPLATVGVARWSQVTEDYVGKPNRTIQDMEQVHDGQVFDLLPLPGNMEPSNFVAQPRNSRIYVRYINLLQRDALMQNFGIDVESDLAAANPVPSGLETPPMLGQFFGRVMDGGLAKTYRLDYDNIDREDYRRATEQVRGEWIERILSYNGRVQFVFDLYREVRLPENLQRKLREQRDAVLTATQARSPGGSNPSYMSGADSSESITVYHNDDGQTVEFTQPKRNGFNSWQGKYIPIGDSIEDLLSRMPGTYGRPACRTIEMIMGGSYAADPAEAKAKAFGGTYSEKYFGEKHNRIHYGTDYDVDGVPCYAVSQGTVDYAVKPGSSWATKRWQWFDITSKEAQQPVLGSARWSSWAITLARAGLIRPISGVTNLLIPGTIVVPTDFKFSWSATGNSVVGTVVRDYKDPNILYYQDYAAGGVNLQIKHKDGSISRYCHLSDVNVLSGQEITEENVKQRLPIGRTGNTFSLVPAYIKAVLAEQFTDATMKFNVRDAKVPSAFPDASALYGTSAHLHFEYWEPTDLDPMSTNDIVVDPSQRAAQDSSDLDPIATKKTHTGTGALIVVDPWKSYANALDKTLPYIKVSEVTPIAEIVAETTSAAVEDGTITTTEAQALVELFQSLDQEGWRYYDDTNIQNLWRRTVSLSVARNNDPASAAEQTRMEAAAHDDPTAFFAGDDCVVTNISGSIRHIMANIPILGSEFPTQQHLGSIEPRYMLEFNCLDQKNLEGLGRNGRALETVRAILQSNARNFRLLQDSYTLLTDTLITRLFGTTRDQDWVRPDAEQGIRETIAKRTLISNADVQNAEGNPGLSVMTWDLEETNPYEGEKIISTSSVPKDLDERRAKVLRAVLNNEFKEGLRGDILPILIAQMAGADLKASPKFTLKTWAPLGSGVWVDNRDGRIHLKNDSHTISELLKFLHIENEAGAEGELVGLFETSVDPNSLADGAVFNMDSRLNREIATVDRLVGGEGGASNVVGQAILNDMADTELMLLGATGSPGLATILIAPLVAGQRIAGGADTVAELFASPSGGRVAGLAATVLSNTVTEAAYGSLMAEIDLSGLLERNPELALIDFQAIVTDIEALRKVLTTWELLIAEERLGGYPDKTVQDQLFGLPQVGCQWGSFQLYFNTFVQHQFAGMEKGHSGSTALTRNPNYLENGGQSGFARAAVATAANANAWKSAFDPLEALASSVWEIFVMAGKMNFAAWYKQCTDNGRHAFIEVYLLGAFPLEIAASEQIAHQYDANFGQLFGPTSTMKDAMQVESLFKEYLDSVNIMFRGGFLTFSQFSVIGTNFGAATIIEPGTNMEEFWASQRMIPIGAAWEAYFASRTAQIKSIDSGLNQIMGEGSVARVATNQLVGWNVINATAFEAVDFQSLGVIGGPAIYPTHRAAEQVKITYLRGLLSKIADHLLRSPEELRAYGLEGLSYIEQSNTYRGLEAYPDMKLPFHPYYETLYDTAPDFYMWSCYEDGGAMSQGIQSQIQQEADQILSNSYSSMTRLQSGYQYNANFDPQSGEPASVVRMSAEGTDQRGGMGTPFANTPATLAAEKLFYDQWENATSGDEIQSGGVTNLKPPKIAGSTTWMEGTAKWTRQLAHLDKPSYAVKVGTSDGSVIYPSRISQDQYKALSEAVHAADEMFGNKAGYAGEEITEANMGDLKGRLSDTQIAQMDQFTHAFDPSSLKKLAQDSSKDIISQKMTMRRAYPTFKLYFVEEDEGESRFLNFDDFYSYNGVKEFSFYESKRDPASTAVITLQNVSGTLDGSVRNTVTDMDYFLKKSSDVAQKQDPSASVKQGDPSTQDTTADQPFGAIALRPGMNVQLRAGYSNDPNALSVLISGRVVDMSWNQGGDLVEITVQSFGTELAQMIKGSASPGIAGQPYWTTHQLLSSLMLEPELQHFGRWEFGQRFQIGEAQGGFDFTDYAQEGYLGQFAFTEYLTKTMIHHPVMFAVAAVGVAALTFLPWSRIGGTVFRGLGKSGILAEAGMSEAKIAAAGSKGFLTKSTATTRLLTALDDAERAVDPNIFSQDLLEAARRSAIHDAIPKLLFADVAAVARNAPKALARELTESVGRVIGGVRGDPVSYASVEKLAETLVAIEREAALRNVAGKFLGVYGLPPLSLSNYTSAGIKAVTTLSITQMKFNVKAGLGLAVTGLTLDSLNNLILRPLVKNTITRITNFFKRTEATMFLSPQDDNLYPPSPKDYMLIGRSWARNYVRAVILSGSRSLVGSADVGEFIMKLWKPDELQDKRMEVDQCRYVLSGTTIWDTFYEMTLRHPGWIYGARPYGRDFRYTMFFGVPSQRYWSKPAANNFIDRMNTLKTFLDSDKSITEQEYRALYGNTMEDGSSFSEYKKNLEEGVMLDQANGYGGIATVPGSQDTSHRIRHQDLEVDARLSVVLNARALKEYLHGLELRFVPFRRYHFISSERDLVWNGLRSSEMSVINAVDVAYYPVDADEDALQMEGTELIKASSTIPEHMLNIRPIQYANCRGYTAAMRYGLGELTHSMKNMYNGEILVLGNARIKPWDICILADSYNDMVGPIEVESVVHNFSFETGFTTEIKPGAVVIANEISTLPILDAMKLWALAIKDMEQNFGGVGDGKGNLLTTAASFIDHYGSGTSYESFIQEKYRKEFGNSGEAFKTVFGQTAPPTQAQVDGLVAAGSSISTNTAGLAAAGALTALWSSGAVVQIDGPTVATNLLIKDSGDSQSGVLDTAFRGTWSGALWSTALHNDIKLPNLAWMVASYVVLAKALREDTVMVIPLMKAGQPIISGLHYKDPGQMWKSYRGEIRHYIEDAMDGTRDAIQDFKQYGTAMWRATVVGLTTNGDPDLTRNAGE